MYANPKILNTPTTQAAEEEEEEEVRPASPKYDERSFFYTTPRLNPARSAALSPQQLQQQPHRPPATPWATPRLPVPPPLHPAAAGGFFLNSSEGASVASGTSPGSHARCAH